jgi:hypothetical protein
VTGLKPTAIAAGGGQKAPAPRSRPAAGRKPKPPNPYRPRHEPAHARIYSHWIHTPAFATLTPHAGWLLVLIMTEYRPQRPNLFPLSNRRAASMLSCAQNTAAKAIGQLLERGLINLERRGGMRGATSARGRFVSLAMFPTESRAGDRDVALDWEPQAEVGRG